MSGRVLTDIEASLSVYQRKQHPLRSVSRRAAVAIMLSQTAGDVNVLMIRRAERKGDPWSGHMAFPGGMVDAKDSHSFAAAVRETEEEIGFQLMPSDRVIGRLSDIRARRARSHSDRGLVVCPYVIRIDRNISAIPNHEVAEVVEVPLSFILDLSNRRPMPAELLDMPRQIPCYQYQDKVIWGMSLAMLDEILTHTFQDHPKPWQIESPV
jgi:8-oxo-dGTP pyrophosphatase MutT (NUDIX family)